jgi:hypothetical protein
VNMRIGFLKLASFVAVGAAALAPASAQAQAPKNRGQLVQAIVKLNQAQLAFAKKLADDPQFAAQFDQAAESGNYDGAASLAASATGLAKSSIAVSGGAPGSDDNHEATSAAATQSVYQRASFSRPKERMLTSGTICFDVGVVRGCIKW